MQAIYQLGNESGKQRLTRDAAAKLVPTARCMVASTGEVDIATMVAKAHPGPLPAGIEARLPSIPTEGLNLWPNLHGEANAGALMAVLQQALRSH